MQIKKLLAASGVAALVAFGPMSTLHAFAADAPTSEAVEAVADAAESVAGEAEAVVEGEAGKTEEGHSTKGGDHGKFSHAEVETRECVEKGLKAGTPIMECIKAPSPILPPVSELAWGSAAFFVVLAGLWKFAMPALRKTMDARSAKIEGDLNAAAKAKTDAESEAATYRSKIGDANAERDRIVEEARAEADRVRRDLLARAEADAAEIRQKASEDSAAQGARLKGELEGHVKRLSVDLAEKVVGANLNRDTNNALVDRYIAELGAK
jgi:F-type H+-transporting ATPase subunit b